MAMRVLRTYVYTYNKYICIVITPIHPFRNYYFLCFLLIEGLSGLGGGNLIILDISL